MADRLSRTFAALADPTRRDIVTRLADADATLTELARDYDVSVQAVAKHLNVLEDAGVVTRRREGRRRPVRLDAEVFDLMAAFAERFRRRTEERYRRLDELLATTDEDAGPRPQARPSDDTPPREEGATA